MTKSDNPHRGSSVEDWLKEEGIYEEVVEEVNKRLSLFLLRDVTKMIT